MGSVFVKQKKVVSRVTEQDKAVLQLKQQRDKMKQYQKRIYTNLERDKELVRRLLKEGKKDRAKLMLRKKKHQEQVLQQTEVQMEKVEEMVHTLEYSQIEMQVVNGLRAGNEALKKIHELLSVDEIERILDETHESVEKQREIDQLLSGALTDQDEEDVLQELDQLIKDQLPDLPLKTEVEKGGDMLVDENIILPEVPEHVPEDKPRREKERRRQQKEAVLAT